MDDSAETVTADVAAHTAGCARCREFSDRARRMRQLARFEVAPFVPHLVPAIMARVRQAAGEGPAGGEIDAPEGPRRAWRRAVGVAAAVGLVAGYLVTAGVRGPSSGGDRALAEEIPHRLVAAAVSL